MTGVVAGEMIPSADHPSDAQPSPLGRWLSASRPLAMGLALALAAWAQRLTDQRMSSGMALVALGAAALIYALAAPVLGRAREEPPTSRLQIKPRALFWAMVFAALGFAGLGGNRITWQGLLCWALGMVLCFVALPGQDRGQTQQGVSWASRALATLKLGRWCISWTTWGLIAAIILGAFLRLHRLWELPSDLGWDLPYNYTDVQRLLRGEYPIFFPDNYGREGMFFYLAAVVARVARLNPYALRLTSALIGIATIPAIYALARECVDRETGVYAAVLLAANKWHLVLTRSGYRVSLMPLFAILALYGLARGLRRGQARDWAWAGLYLGLGLWTYKAFIYAVPMVIGCAAVYVLLHLTWPSRREEVSSPESLAIRWGGSLKVIGPGIGLMMLVAMVVAAPLLRFVVDSPQVYLARELHAARLVSESLSGQGASWWQNMRRDIVVSLLMYNYEGDGNSRFGVPYQRHLGYISGVLLILGVAAALARFRRGGNALLVLSTLILIAPMTASMLVGEAPNCFRSSGTIGPVLVLGAMGIRALRGEMTRLLAHLRVKSIRIESGSDGDGLHTTRTFQLKLSATVLPVLLILPLLGGELCETTRFYFHDFALVIPDVANYSVAQEMAKTAIAFGEPSIYVKVWPHWFDGRAMNIYLEVAGHPPLQEILELGADKPPLAGFQGRMLVFLHPQDTASLAALEGIFPRRAVVSHHFPNGDPSYVAFYGEK